MAYSGIVGGAYFPAKVENNNSILSKSVKLTLIKEVLNLYSLLIIGYIKHIECNLAFEAA